MGTDKSDSAHDWTLLVQTASQAANQLQMSEQELAVIIGGSDQDNDDRLLNTLAGGDAAITISWLRSYNTALFGCPIELMRSSAGFRDVLGHLESPLCR